MEDRIIEATQMVEMEILPNSDQLASKSLQEIESKKTVSLNNKEPVKHEI